eukprot:gene9479-biopygen982
MNDGSDTPCSGLGCPATAPTGSRHVAVGGIDVGGVPSAAVFVPLAARPPPVTLDEAVAAGTYSAVERGISVEGAKRTGQPASLPAAWI